MEAGRDRSRQVCSAHGPLAVEALLADHVRADRAAVRADPRLLARPLVIVVPSRSLRLHVAARLAEWCEGACAGVELVTLFGAAHAVLLDAGVAAPRGSLLFEDLAGRALAAEAHLAARLGPFEDAGAVLAATLRDLFDAGFEPSHAEALDELLSSPARGATDDERATARALVRAAVHVSEDARRAGLGLPGALLRRAAGILRVRPGALPARGVWIHGFADATGAALDFLEAVLARPGTRLYHDALFGGEHGAPLRARLGLPGDPAEPTPVRVGLSRAPSGDREARAAVERVRAALAAGTAPERIAIVARDPAPYRVALRRHLTRLAVPFSSLSVAGSDGPAERRARALSELLESRADCPLERWLDARDTDADVHGSERVVLRAGLHALGTPRLGALASLDLDARLDGRDTLKLAVRVRVPERDLDEDADGPEDGSAEDAQESEPSDPAPAGAGVRFERRVVTRTALEAERKRARDTLAALERDATHAVGRHVALARAFAREILGWGPDTAGAAILDEALGAIERDLGLDHALTAATFDALLARCLVEHARPPLGGAGAGVAVLDVTEARGRTFEHVEVLGVARGRFPRTIREDPLLPDALRARLAELLGDLVRKGAGRDEERGLFDALVRSAPRVHLSWPALDDADKRLLPSALLERVATPADVAAAPFHVPDPALARPAHEHALAAALAGGRDAFEAVLPHALAEVRAHAGLAPASPAPLAAARAAVFDEYEPAFARQARLGPYFGLVGRADARDDLRHGALWVTQLETLSKCGWQAFLRHLLKLEPPLDPSADLPDVDALLVGEVVHAVLQRVYDRRGTPGRWPDRDALQKLLFATARAAALERGILLPGFERLVVSRVEPALAVARALDEAETGVTAEDSEVEGHVDLPEGFLGPRTLSFRADRVDRLPGGTRFTDYKTGQPISDRKTPATRHAHHLTGIANGTRLQAIAYALAAGTGGSGRYVFLKEDLPDEQRVFSVEDADEAAREHFDAAVTVLLGAWDLGAFTPRLLGKNLADENRNCASCEVKLACLRGDSTAHRRLASFVVTPAAAESADVAAARALWELAGRKHAAPARAASTPADGAEPKPKRKRS